MGTRKEATPSASGRAKKAIFGHLQRDTRRHTQTTTRSGGRRSKPTRLRPEQCGGGPSTAKRSDFVKALSSSSSQHSSCRATRPQRLQKSSRGWGFFLSFLIFIFCLFWFCFALVVWFSLFFFFFLVSAAFCQQARSLLPGKKAVARLSLELRREKQKVLKGRRAETEHK